MTATGLAVFDEARGGRFASPPVFESGAGGLVSTAGDCLAFCRMLLNNGTHGNERILSRLSVELIEYLRPEAKFETLDALVAQMDADCARARAILAHMPASHNPA